MGHAEAQANWQNLGGAVTGITDTSNQGLSPSHSGPVQPYAAASFRGGLIGSLSVDVVQTPGKTSIFLGVGPGVGLSISSHAGIGAGSADGLTVKGSVTGGFGGVARGSWTMYGNGPGNAYKAGFGAGAGASATVAFGWTQVFENDPRH